MSEFPEKNANMVWNKGLFLFSIRQNTSRAKVDSTINHQMLSISNEWFCGYCRFPYEILGDKYMEISKKIIEVHGGITYCIREEYEDIDTIVFGFDCQHYLDVNNPNTTDIKWLTKECEKIALSVLRYSAVLPETLSISNIFCPEEE